MKKLALIFLSSTLLFAGCKDVEEPVEEVQGNGPIVETDQRTDEEKELDMIKNCIRDYNEDLIEEREEYFQMQLPTLPLDVTSLPEVDSLKDLTPLDIDPNSNLSYLARLDLNDNYYAVIAITNPTGVGFWINGSIDFRINPDDVVEANPEYDSTRTTLNNLFSNSYEILNDLYGINVELSEEPIEDEYYRVKSFETIKAKSIDDLKQIAESIYTKEFLEEHYYPTSFEGDYPVYKMINGKLCCVQSMLTAPLKMDLDPNYICSTKKDGDLLKIDILSKVMDQVQPHIQRVILKQTEDGYRLTHAY